MGRLYAFSEIHRRRKEGKRFFFEKKKQKTFANCGRGHKRGHSPRLAEVFLLLFFQKKKRLLTHARSATNSSLSGYCKYFA
jgi:hypothetical protein